MRDPRRDHLPPARPAGHEVALYEPGGDLEVGFDEAAVDLHRRAAGRGGPEVHMSLVLHTTGLDADERRITGVELVEDLDSAIAASIARHGDPAVAVIPEGPYVVPVLAGAHA